MEIHKECLDTNWVSSAGSYVDRFENDIKDYLKVQNQGYIKMELPHYIYL